MEHGEIKEAGGGGMTTSSSSAAARKGSSGSHEVLKCPRCDSLNTKFCYYNNYNLSQPRHFCKNCRRYWTKGGSLRSVPVGGGCRKNKRSRHGSSGPNASGAIRSNLTSSVSLLDVGHLSGSGGPSTSAFLNSVPPHLLQLHDYASASSAAANHNNFGLTFSRLQESMRSSPSASLMMPSHSYEPLNLNPHLNLDQTSLVNHLGIYNNNNSNTLNTTSCTNTTNTNTNHNNHNPPPATDLSLLIDDHHRPFTANTTSTAPAVAHAEWSKLHAEHHPHKLGLTSNCMQLMQMNDHDHENDHDHGHGHGHGHGHHGFGHIIPPPGFPEEEKPLTGQSNTIDHQQHQWFQGGVQQMESGILQEGWAWPDFFSLAGSAAGTIP